MSAPVTFKNRGQIVHPTDTVQLKAVFKDMSGNFIDPDAFPAVSIIDPTGFVMIPPTTAGVVKNSVGNYEYDVLIDINPSLGVYSDVWSATIQGYPQTVTFQFIVSSTDLPKPNSDGYAALGDDIGFNYSQIAIVNINKIVKGLRARLKSSGKSKSIVNGNVVYKDCDIYSPDMLVTFAVLSLSNFNAIPHFTSFTFDDSQFIDQFMEMLVQGATLYALSGQALIEKGREYQITDNGITFTPPTISEVLQSQYGTLLAAHNEQLKQIKASMKPAARGVGTISVNSVSPLYSRLRFRRAGRYF